MRIEEIKPSQRKQGRLLVKLEDGTILRLSEAEAASFGLREGMELDSGQLEAIQAAVRRSAARRKAAELAGSRALSRRELEQKLTRKGLTKEDVQDAADWLEDLGAIDDGDYARLVARHYGDRGYGPGRVRQELLRRGVPKEFWEDALEQLPEARESIDAYLRKKCGSAAPDERERKRLCDALLRRGFSWDQVRQAMGDGFPDPEDGSM